MKVRFIIAFSFLIVAGPAALGQPKLESGKKSGEVKIDSIPEYLPVEGRSPTGVIDELEGVWVLVSLPGAAKGGKTNVPPGKKNKANPEVERIDSSIVLRPDGSKVITTTTVFTDKEKSEGRITPPQGEKMHVPAKPSIRFYGSNETFSGYTGCNKMSGRYKLSGKNLISFSEAAASTKMACMGVYDEKAFLNILHSVTRYSSANNKLTFLDGDKVLMVFEKKTD